jgi:acyl-coenzyme A synthetase/AMP-(fatty) acid ligase/acyl carrier protein
LREQAITTVTLPPSLLAILPAAALPALATLISAGEQCYWDVAARWATGHRFFNAYGPTEATIGPTLYQVGDRMPDTTSVPIGRPISSTDVYVLDARLRPVPVGVPGELYIGGVGLARGYHNRPDLTAAQFIPHPFSATPGARLYRTGDLARYRPDGNLEFLGRSDQQVKLRGLRIELGEIEAALRQQPAVREAVVVAREDTPGAKRLVAYVVPRPGPPPTASELRSSLRHSLPDYMLPAAFVLLPALPLTPNGKLDRRALPTPDTDRPALDRAFAPPETPLQEILAGFWIDVLGLKQVGIDDNFFELGGHSLLATQIASRISQAFQTQFQVRSLFEAPTVAGLARHLIAAEPQPGQTEKIAQILKRIKQMPAENRLQALQQHKAR